MLSVIIVNYNVRYFLEQCLYSVRAAARRLDDEGGSNNVQVIVIDNASVDDPVSLLQPAFPKVNFIRNTQNVGFGKACNQGLSSATGDYILFLNPDTIVPEDCFLQCINFLKQHPAAGALGVRMMDGAGRFLRESKRSFPSPLTSMYKLSGLARLFPSSPMFARYHLGHLAETVNHEVDVLSGAFMMIRKEVLDITGGFDETFFMYGEDVDLSYRIQQAGFSNHYFSGARIIHYKGESTRKSSANYVRMFYLAMSQFVRKHHGGSRAGIFNAFIQVAIRLRAAWSAIGQFIRKAGLPIIDALLIFGSFWLIKEFWNGRRPDVVYDHRLLHGSFLLLTGIYMLTAYYAGLYDRYYKRPGLWRTALIATLVILAMYSLLPEHLRFSRAIILFGALLATIGMSLLRVLLNQLGVVPFNRAPGHAGLLVVGTASDQQEVIQLIQQAGLTETLLGRVAVAEDDHDAVAHYRSLPDQPILKGVHELVCCTGELSYRDFIDLVASLKRQQVSIRVHAAGSMSMVGSDSRNRAGDVLSADNSFNLANPSDRRLKRLLDVLSSLVLLLLFPVHFFTMKKPGRFFRNLFSVLSGSHTWIGYACRQPVLPRLRPGIITASGLPLAIGSRLPAEAQRNMDYWYAHDFEPMQDLGLLFRHYRNLGSI